MPTQFVFKNTKIRFANELNYEFVRRWNFCKEFFVNRGAEMSKRRSIHKYETERASEGNEE